MHIGRVTMFVVMMVAFASGCSDDSTSVSVPSYSALSDTSFAVGDAAVLEVGNFAGRIDVRSGAPGQVMVTTRKRARRAQDLDRIELEMVELQNGVRVNATNPDNVTNVSVDVEVLVPPDIRPLLQIGAGEISYEGLAEGDCVFGAGAGSISLRLRPDVNVSVLLTVGAGLIRVDFPVSGQVNDKVVDGIIGTGTDGNIVAQVGAGQIIVLRQAVP